MISVNICSPTLDIAVPWDDLVRRASSNVFMNPVALTVANETGFARIQVLLAWDDSAGPRRLVGVWAFQVRRISPLWPALLEALPYNYAFLSSPVVDPAYRRRGRSRVPVGDPGKPAAAQGDQSEVARCGGAELRDACERADGAGRRAAQIVREHAAFRDPGSWRETVRLDPEEAAAGLEPALRRRRGRYRQQPLRRIRERRSRRFWSWKPEAGRARAARRLLCDAADAAFARQMVIALAERGNASVALLRVDGRAIAAQVLMYCGATAYTWKTAFSPDYAKYSPGALLIDKITDDLFSSAGIEAINSCSSEGSFMAQLWAGPPEDGRYARRCRTGKIAGVFAGGHPPARLRPAPSASRPDPGLADAGRIQKQESEFCRASLGLIAACDMPPGDRVDLWVTLYLNDI